MSSEQQSKLLERRAEVMQDWSDYVTQRQAAVDSHGRSIMDERLRGRFPLRLSLLSFHRPVRRQCEPGRSPASSSVPRPSAPYLLASATATSILGLRTNIPANHGSVISLCRLAC